MMSKFLIVSVDSRLDSNLINCRGSEFNATDGEALVGMYNHVDDSYIDGTTGFRVAQLKLYDPSGGQVPSAKITVCDFVWSCEHEESSHNYVAPFNQVLTGFARGVYDTTKYQTGVITVNGQPAKWVNVGEDGPIREDGPIIDSAGIWWECSPLELMVGRRHEGGEDGENGKTFYKAATFEIEL